VDTREFERHLASGTYDLIVLDVLRDGPAYGYGLRRRIYDQSHGALIWPEGSLYPVLHHLEKQGLVVSEWQGPKGGRRRRYYRLTAGGRRGWRVQRNQWRFFSRAVNAVLGL
jgi:PadR family transcriptional regulator, regulatory protein PadR